MQKVERIQFHLIITVAVAVILAFSLFSPAVSATSSSPNVCLKQASGGATSSDGTMNVGWITYTCGTNYEGQVSFDAYSGGSYSGSPSATVCGSTKVSASGVDDWFVGQAAYSSGHCYYYYTTATFSFNQQFGNTFPISTGALTVSEGGWSGNCNTIFGSSPCSVTDVS